MQCFLRIVLIVDLAIFIWRQILPALQHPAVLNPLNMVDFLTEILAARIHQQIEH